MITFEVTGTEKENVLVSDNLDLESVICDKCYSTNLPDILECSQCGAICCTLCKSFFIFREYAGHFRECHSKSNYLQLSTENGTKGASPSSHQIMNFIGKISSSEKLLCATQPKKIGTKSTSQERHSSNEIAIQKKTMITKHLQPPDLKQEKLKISSNSDEPIILGELPSNEIIGSGPPEILVSRLGETFRVRDKVWFGRLVGGFPEAGLIVGFVKGHEGYMANVRYAERAFAYSCYDEIHPVDTLGRTIESFERTRNGLRSDLLCLCFKNPEAQDVQHFQLPWDDAMLEYAMDKKRLRSRKHKQPSRVSKQKGVFQLGDEVWFSRLVGGFPQAGRIVSFVVGPDGHMARVRYADKAYSTSKYDEIHPVDSLSRSVKGLYSIMEVALSRKRGWSRGPGASTDGMQVGTGTAGASASPLDSCRRLDAGVGSDTDADSQGEDVSDSS